MKIILTILGLTFFSFAVFAQNKMLKPGNAASVNISPERLQRIDKFIQNQIESGSVNGAVGLIARDGKIIYNKAFGLDDVGKRTPLKTDAIFRIASQTKAITSVAVMILFEEGKFLLDDPIAKYLPSFTNQQVIAKFNAKDTSYTTVPAKRAVTIRDLLTHTSGIGYAQIGRTDTMNAIYAKAGIKAGFVSEPVLLSDAMNKLGKLPLFHQPGKRFTYGLNTDVLGYLVEVISGMSLDDFMRKRIFEPLGMNDTYFYLPPSKYNRLVRGYFGVDNNHFKLWDENNKPQIYVDYPKVKGTYYSGGGGLSSTVKDYAIFLQMLLNGGYYNGHQILSKHTVNLMTSNQMGDLLLDRDNRFGLGFAIITEAGQARLGQSEGSYWWSGFWSTQFWVDPKERLVCLLFMQQFPIRWDLFDKYKVAVYQALEN